MSGKGEVKARCAKCGSDQFVIPDNPKDSSVVTCHSCGTQIGKWGDLKAALTKKAEKEAQTAIRKAFKGSKDIRFK
jgi:ribosomal protein S27E